MKNVIITGASGMIGGLILKECLASDDVGKVTSVVRKPSGIIHDKLNEIVHADFMNFESISHEFENQDVAFFCIGVYTGAVKSDLFRHITVDYPKAFAEELAKHSKNISFNLLSGQGADRSEKSRIMFAKDKGAAENLIEGFGFKEFHTFRPGYIYPVEKRPEPNISYRIMRFLYPIMKLFGSNASVKSTELASVMTFVGIKGSEKEIWENRDIVEFFNIIEN